MFIRNEKKNYYKQAKAKTKIRQRLWLGVPVHYLRSSACFKGVGSAAYFQRLTTSRESMRILHSKGPIEIAFQFRIFGIASLVVKYEPKDGLPGVSLLHLLLMVHHRSFPMIFKSRFLLLLFLCLF